MKEIILGFKQFILRGNVLDLAVGVVIGAAFGALINSVVIDIITPLLSLITGSADFSDLVWKVNGTEIRYGNFINSLLSFVIISMAIYFFVIVPMKRFWSKDKEGDDKAPQREDIILLQEIRDLLKNRS